jgi:hypothetical protein
MRFSTTSDYRTLMYLERHGVALGFHKDVVAQNVDRSFIKTKGSFMGTAPPLTEVGDLVVLLSGLDLPLLLKPAGDS